MALIIHMCSARKKYVQMAEERMGNDHNARHILHQRKFVLIEQILTRGVKFNVKILFFHNPNLSVYIKRKVIYKHF
jgi:hypothetical protein